MHEVAAWPSGEVDLLLTFLSVQPAPEERVEMAVATLTSWFANVHLKEGAAPVCAKDFMPFLDPWPKPQASRYSDTDMEVMRAFGLKA